ALARGAAHRSGRGPRGHPLGAGEHAGARPRRTERGQAGRALVRARRARARCVARFHVRRGLPARRRPRGAREGREAPARSVHVLPRASRPAAAGVPSGPGRSAGPCGRSHRGHDGPVRSADLRAALPSPGLAPVGRTRPRGTGVARIRQDDIDAVKERTAIVQLVGHYPTLKKSGHDSLSGLCPFHQEKTASFSVSPSKQVFYCFGCGKGGDAITFLRELEHLSYVEAIERLAQTAGVHLRYEGDSLAERRAAERRAALYRANEEAAALFRTMLAGGREAEDARAYVTERGITAEAI